MTETIEITGTETKVIFRTGLSTIHSLMIHEIPTEIKILIKILDIRTTIARVVITIIKIITTETIMTIDKIPILIAIGT